jgi:transposase
MNKLIEKLSWLKNRIQKDLFPHLAECFNDPITEKQRQLIAILEVVEVERYVRSASYQWMGRKLSDRCAIARAFVAKAVYNLKTSVMLIETLKAAGNVRRICGFEKRSDIPSESTFSRAFAEFAESELGDRVHEALVKSQLAGQLIGHIARDATAIEGREKPQKKAKPVVETVRVPKKKGRPKKGEVRESKAEDTRLKQQVNQTAAEGLADVPTACDVGCKKNAKGYKETWVGYKLHLDTADCGLPVTAVLTSASVHDSQVAIPMLRMSTGRVEYLYDLMDSAYDAAQIREVSRGLGHVPIIDPNPRGQKVVPLSPAESVRYNERSASERANARLKEEFGGDNVMVRGAKKVKLHLMFGVIALFADQLLKLVT